MMNWESKKEQEIREKTSPKAASLHWEEELSFDFFKITESTMLISNSYQPYFSGPITNFNEEIRQKQESKRRRKKQKQKRADEAAQHDILLGVKNGEPIQTLTRAILIRPEIDRTNYYQIYPKIKSSKLDCMSKSTTTHYISNHTKQSHIKSNKTQNFKEKIQRH